MENRPHTQCPVSAYCRFRNENFASPVAFPLFCFVFFVSLQSPPYNFREHIFTVIKTNPLTLLPLLCPCAFVISEAGKKAIRKAMLTKDQCVWVVLETLLVFQPRDPRWRAESLRFPHNESFNQVYWHSLSNVTGQLFHSLTNNHTLSLTFY